MRQLINRMWGDIYMAVWMLGLGLGGVTYNDPNYPVFPEDDGTDRPRNPYGPH